MARKLLVISDVHSNIEALEAVLADAHYHGPFDMRLCAGDIVGYGPDPNKVVERIASDGFICVRGNHDRAVVSGDWSNLNDHAAAAAEHNAAKLSEPNMDFLRGLSNVPYRDPRSLFSMVHGSFDGAPEEKGNKCRYEDIYVFLRLNAKRAMRAMDTPLGIIGHTHDPLLVRRRGAFIREITYTLVGSEGVGVYRNGFSFDQNSRALVNFGSVGQPRDGDPRAAYGLVTIEARKVMLEFRRVPYNIPAIQQKMWAEGLPDSLAKRLAEGT